MDDFGTGYSSLAALRQLPIDIIKIDKSFVTELADSQTSVDMVRNVLQLAADLKLRTVAEGVEHNDQLELLRQLGCDTIQGYLFARPQPLAQLSERLNQQPALHTAPALQVR
jgi:EAL domain-containing protein (putative c-di-GMP-specific phosphodiesterase class I)